jgi:hypothetical protein
MLSIAMSKTTQVKPITIQVKPITIKQELPKHNPIYSITYDKDLKSPSRDVKCSFDNTHFGTSPPGKNFLNNLKLRIQNM